MVARADSEFVPAPIKVGNWIIVFDDDDEPVEACADCLEPVADHQAIVIN